MSPEETEQAAKQAQKKAEDAQKEAEEAQKRAQGFREQLERDQASELEREQREGQIF